MPAEDKRDRRAPARLILLMRGLRQFSYGLLAVILGVVLTEEGFSPASIGVLITVSLVGDMAGTYPIGLFADSWGRRRTLALLMAATGAVFGLVSSYAVLLVAAFFGTLGTTASETAPFLPIDQAMLAQVTLPERRTGQFARYNLVASLSTAPGALAAGLPALLASVGLPLASGIRLLFGLYALLGLVVASFSLRLSASVEAPGHPPVEARRLGHRLAPPLHRSRGIIWRLTALFSVDALAGGLVEPDERTAAASVTSLAHSLGSATSPVFSGLLLQGPLLVLGLPFILAGRSKPPTTSRCGPSSERCA